MHYAATLLYLYVESPLHAGVGFVEDAPVDLPIQREEMSGYPLIRSSSLKGSFRALTRTVAQEADVLAVFGPKPETWKESGAPETQAAEQEAEPEKFAGALTLGDAHLLLFPVRSLVGVYAWVTSADILARFLRDVGRRGLAAPIQAVPAPPEGAAWVAPNSRVVTEQAQLVLEEFTFKAQMQRAMTPIGHRFAEDIFPQDDVFHYWRQKVQTDLVVLPEDAFRYFVTTRTEVIHRIRIDPETGTADEGALWTEEYLPTDTVLYTPVNARTPHTPTDRLRTGKDVLAWIDEMSGGQVQIGSGRTLGRGLVRLRWHPEEDGS